MSESRGGRESRAHTAREVFLFFEFVLGKSFKSQTPNCESHTWSTFAVENGVRPWDPLTRAKPSFKPLYVVPKTVGVVLTGYVGI